MMSFNNNNLHSSPTQTANMSNIMSNRNWPPDSDSGAGQQQQDEARPCSSASISSTATAVSQSLNFQQGYTNSLAIRAEIQRFESVHPSIYAIYDLLELIGNTVHCSDNHIIAQRMRDHIVCIEDSFVNSQEWTLSRAVPDLRLGVVGTISSGKSALVHRYLTGSYLQDESPEGGRFKKEVTVNDQSYLLLIRDEGGAPELQLSCWVDAVLFVFSLEDESSFNAIYSYYSKMIHLRSNSDIPVFLVGTQEAISETNPRVIDESRARKLCLEMKRCTYFETCATNGLRVDEVFNEACKQIVLMRNCENNPTHGYNSRPSTPNHTGVYRSMVNSIATSTPNSINNGTTIQSHTPTPLGNITNNSKYRHMQNSPAPTSSPSNNCGISLVSDSLSSTNSDIEFRPRTVKVVETTASNTSPIRSSLNAIANTLQMNTTTTTTKPAIAAKPKLQATSVASPVPKSSSPAPVAPKRSESIKLSNESQFKVPVNLLEKELPKEQVTPVQTPNISRKNRRKSNLFTPLSGKSKNSDEKYKNGEVGIGRAIPVKQGYLYKKSKKTLNKDWKKKYVTLTTDGCLTYHRTLHDYMNEVNGKNIPLKHTTVKIPGQKPRCGRSNNATQSPNHLETDAGNTTQAKMVPITNPKYEGGLKKRSRKLKSIGTKNSDNADDSDGNEFVIVSLDNKQWYFNAHNTEEREEWVCAIEQQILSSLQNSQIDKSKLHNVNSVDESTVHSIKTVPGNKYCVDCDAPNPDWASLNLGTLICIECSGIHRKLGTHISKVRSLTLDVWPTSHVSVMLGLGNTAANKIWEFHLKAKTKPSPTSSYEEKEKYIRAKYEAKQYLAPLPDHPSIEQQIIECVTKMDIKQLALVLAHISLKGINLSTVLSREKKTPLHLAASRGCLEITQLLLWYNIDEKAVDTEGKTALFYARISGHKEIEELLVQSGCSSTTNYDNKPPTIGPANCNDTNNKSQMKKRESIPLNVRQIEMFNKLPASII